MPTMMPPRKTPNERLAPRLESSAANRWSSAAVWLVMITLLVVLRMHAWSLPLETDECNYAYIGERLLDGDRLYVDVWDHQPPGVFVLFASVIWAFGSSDVAFRGLAAVSSVCAMALIYAAFRAWFSPTHEEPSHGVDQVCNRWWALAAAGVFALVSADPGTAGDGCNREIYMNVFGLAALAALIRKDSLADPAPLIIAGTLLGLGSTFKTVMAAPWLLLTIWTAGRAWSRGGGFAGAVRSVAYMAIGPAAVWAAIGIYFASTGRWDAMIEAVFAFNVGYSGLNRNIFGRFVDVFTGNPDVFISAWPLWATAVVGVLATAATWIRHRSPRDGLILAYVLGCLIAVALPGRCWPHYYYLLVPPAVLVATSLVCRFNRNRHRILAATILIVAVMACTIHYYALRDPNTLGSPAYAYRRAWARAQGLRILELTDPGDTIFVWGQDTGIYHYARRRCASRYTMITGLSENARDHKTHRKTLLRELRENRPRLVLIVETEFDELKRFLQDGYVVTGVDRDDRNPKKTIMLALTDQQSPVRMIDWEWRAPWLVDPTR
jgi:hypothetical protein